jgi:hypothetical protein
MQNKPKVAGPRENEGGNVHFLTSFKEAPEPNIPLLAAGRKVYDEWCRTLIKAGLLTLKTREYVEMLAIATDDIAVTIEKGKRPTRQAMEAKRAAMMKLEKLDVADTIATPGGNQSIYAGFGFARRARAARHGQN